MLDFQIIDCEQGSPEWHQARAGIPTASEFQTILALGKGRASYLWTLASERMTEEPAPSYSNADMERGKLMEPVIRRDYEFRTGNQVQQIGFMRNAKCGCSTDGLVGDDGVVEFKSSAPHILGPLIETGTFPNQYKAQCQGPLMISGRQWCDLVVFWHPKMPALRVRAERDELYIAALRDAIDVFDLELRRLVKKLQAM